MKRILIKTKVRGTPKEIINSFNKDLLLKVTPPLINVEITQYDGHSIGDEIHIISSLFGNYQSWVNTVIDAHETENLIYFTDKAKEMPFPITSWEHTHKIQKLDETFCYIIDDIKYDTGSSFSNAFIYPLLYACLYYRKPIYMDTFNG